MIGTRLGQRVVDIHERALLRKEKAFYSILSSDDIATNRHWKSYKFLSNKASAAHDKHKRLAKRKKSS